MTDAPGEPHHLGHSGQAKNERAYRRVRVADGVAARKSYRQIAADEGIDHSTVVRDVKVIRRYWQIRAALSYDVLVREEEQILDRLHREAMRQVTLDHVLVSHGKVIPNVIDEGAKLAALDRVLKVRESLRKLKGIDAAQRAEVKVTVEQTTTLDAEIESLMAAMRERDDAHDD